MSAPQEADILELLARAKRHFGDGVASGNCGQLAWAVARILKDRGANPTLGILAEEVESVDALLDDVDIYHVVVEVDGKRYDGEGVVSDETLLEYAAEYRDPSPLYWTGLELTETTRLIISGNTNWSIQWPEFYRVLVGEKVIGKVPRVSAA